MIRVYIYTEKQLIFFLKNKIQLKRVLLHIQKNVTHLGI